MIFQIEKLGFDELSTFQRLQAQDTFPDLKDEGRLKMFAEKWSVNADCSTCRDDEGNLIGMIAFYANGVDMITGAVRAAVGDPVFDIEQKPLNGCWAEIIVHADKTGILERIEVDQEYEPYVIEKDFWFKRGDEVKEFQSARDAIGTLVVRFDNSEHLEYAITHQREWLKVIVK